MFLILHYLKYTRVGSNKIRWSFSKIQNKVYKKLVFRFLTNIDYDHHFLTSNMWIRDYKCLSKHELDNFSFVYYEGFESWAPFVLQILRIWLTNKFFYINTLCIKMCCVLHLIVQVVFIDILT